jgi:hypothetical protein
VNELRTKDYCRVIDARASLQVIDNINIKSIRDKLVNNNALGMVLYKVSEGKYHAVVIGYDPVNNYYFYKDPNEANFQIGDILSQKEITEYIVFDEAPKFDGTFILKEDYLYEDKDFLINSAPLNYFYGKEVFFTIGLKNNKFILYQMIGNLGAYANDYELENSISVFVMSDSLYGQMKMGFKNEVLKLLESKLNAKGQSFKDLLIITESSLVDFVKKRTSYYDDRATQALINSLQDS